jgi:hypothetical protein
MQALSFSFSFRFYPVAIVKKGKMALFLEKVQKRVALFFF